MTLPIPAGDIAQIYLSRCNEAGCGVKVGSGKKLGVRMNSCCLSEEPAGAARHGNPTARIKSLLLLLPPHLSSASLWAEPDKEKTQGNRGFRIPAPNQKIEYTRVGLKLRETILSTTRRSKIRVIISASKIRLDYICVSPNKMSSLLKNNSEKGYGKCYLGWY